MTNEFTVSCNHIPIMIFFNTYPTLRLQLTRIYNFACKKKVVNILFIIVEAYHIVNELGDERL